MDPNLLLLLVSAAVVILLSAFCSMTEAAFLSLSVLRAEALCDSTRAVDRAVGKMRLDFDRPLSTIVIVNNIANIAGTAATTTVATGVFNSTWTTVFMACMTVAVILFGEIVPKTLGERYPLKVGRGAALIVRTCQVVLLPLIWLAELVQKPFSAGGRGHRTSEEEITRLTELGEEQGAIEPHEGDMIQRVFRLNDILAENIMTSRVDVVSLPAEKTLAEVAHELGETKRSRIPLYREQRDEVVAVLDRMDALLELAKDNSQLKLGDPSISFRPLFVPKSIPADDLMALLQRRTEPLAIVVGDYGEMVGVITLEDVLEELVGEIIDDEDVRDGADVHRKSSTECVALGRAEVKEVNDVIGTELPNHRTVAGLLLDELERIPRKGEQVNAHGARFIIDDVTDRAILKVHITRMPAAAEDDEI